MPAEKVPEHVSWTAFFFRIRENFFQSFHTKFLSLLYMRSLEYKISPCLSANQNPELRCVISTGVTLFAPVLHFLHWCYTWTAPLSANQNRVFFSCVLLVFSVTPFKIDQNKKSKPLNRLRPESGNTKKVYTQILSPRFRSQQFFLWKIYRGYYMPARGYEFYLRVVNSTSHEWAQRTSEISSWPREDKIHIHKRACNILFII